MTGGDLNEYIGDIGVYQWLVFIVVFLFNLFNTETYHIIFLGDHMPHWCCVPELEDLPYDVQKNVAIPAQSVNRDGFIDEYSSCEMYSLNYSIYNHSEFYTWNRSLMITNETSIVRCSQWTYDQSQFISTIVKKFDLVCGWNFLVQFVSTSYMGGYLVGAISSGAVSDKFGRKKTILGFTAVKIVGILMSVFGSTYTPFVIGRFLMGCGMGSFLPTYVLIMEIVGKRYRPVLGTTVLSAYAFGIMIQTAIAFFLRDEFWYQVAATAPNFVFPFVVTLVIPESPRWLVVNHRYEDVLRVLKKICRINNRRLPEDFKPTCLLAEPQVVRDRGCSILLTSRIMRMRTIIMDITWFTCSMIYYALAFNVGTLHGNIYLNTFIAGAVEIPAYIVGTYLMDRRPFGRRWTGFIGMAGSGMCSFICVFMIIFKHHVVTVAFAMLGKGLISVTFCCLYVFTNEIFPTEVRNVGVGAAVMFGGISNMAAAYFGGPLGLVWKPLPSLLFGVGATFSGLLYVFLPETLGQILPDTIEQAEQLGKRSNVKHAATCENGDMSEPCTNQMLTSVVEVQLPNVTDVAMATVAAAGEHPALLSPHDDSLALAELQ